MRILLCHPNACGDMYPLALQLRSAGNRVFVLQEEKMRRQGKRRTLVEKVSDSCSIHNARRRSHFFREEGDGLDTIHFNPSTGLEKLLTFPLDRAIRRSPYRGNLAHRMWMIFVAVEKFNPDVILACDGFHYGVPAALLKRLGLLQCALVVQFIGGDALDEPEADCGVRRTPITRWMYRQVLMYATLIRPFSPMLGQILLQELDVPKKLRVVPGNLQSIEQSTLIDIRANRNVIGQKIRMLHSIPETSPIIVTLSNNQQGKGLQYLAQAWPKIQEKIPECYWLLVGPESPWFAKELKPALVEHTHIKIVGKAHGGDVFRYLAIADLLVNPTLADGLNLVTAEAAAVGTPSIITDKAGIADWVQRHEGGKVIPAYNTVALTLAVVKFFEMDDESREEMRYRCIEMASDFFVESVAERLLKVFKEAIVLDAREAARQW